jgi:hypothetical protein
VKIWMKSLKVSSVPLVWKVEEVGARILNRFGHLSAAVDESGASATQGSDLEALGEVDS